MEDLMPFYVEFEYKDEVQLAEIKPCCQEENIFYYDISMNNQYQFTITPTSNDTDMLSWRLALKNADKQVEPELVQVLGEQIDRYNMA